MTNKEAIEHLKRIKHDINFLSHLEAINIAISVLEQQPEPEVWIDAEWPKDAADPPKKARFKDSEKDTWMDGILIGKTKDGYWVTEDFDWFLFCQVVRSE